METVDYFGKSVVEPIADGFYAKGKPSRQNLGDIFDPRFLIGADHVEVHAAGPFKISGGKQVKHEGIAVHTPRRRGNDDPDRFLMVGFIPDVAYHGELFLFYLQGNLFRIAGKDGDAIGQQAAQVPELSDNATDKDVEQLVWDQLHTCFDPEIPIDIVELGLVYNCVLRKEDTGEREVDIDMTLTAPGCGMGEILASDVRSKVEMIPTIRKANVELVFDPPWSSEMMSEAARLQTGMY